MFTALSCGAPTGAPDQSMGEENLFPSHWVDASETPTILDRKRRPWGSLLGPAPARYRVVSLSEARNALQPLFGPAYMPAGLRLRRLVLEEISFGGGPFEPFSVKMTYESDDGWLTALEVEQPSCKTIGKTRVEGQSEAEIESMFYQELADLENRTTDLRISRRLASIVETVEGDTLLNVAVESGGVCFRVPNHSPVSVATVIRMAESLTATNGSSASD